MLQAIVLGLVQGLTEFLPVSSSGHLVIVPYLLSWPQPPLSFDIALHAGTLLALLVYFAGDLWYLATRMIGVGVEVEGEAARARRTVALLAVASVPAAVLGLTLKSTFEGLFDEPQIAAGFLYLTAGLLYLAEHLRRRRAAAVAGVPADREHRSALRLDPGRDETTIGWLDAVTIGAGQALAILPGVSRAGATMSFGMLRGLSREAAARFSFLMAIPIIIGATAASATELADGLRTTEAYGGAELVVGVLVAAFSGYWAIRYLLRLVARDDLTGFARYVALFATLTLVGYLWIGPASSV